MRMRGRKVLNTFWVGTKEKEEKKRENHGKFYQGICKKMCGQSIHTGALAGVCGVVLGFVAGLFGRCITIVTGFRQTHEWMLYLLPLAGLVIVAMYRFDPYKSDTNRVLEGIQSGKYVPLRMSPLIIASTILTHACGGSAGREGAALQLGGSLGGTIGKWLKLDEYDQKAMIMCGMSAAFSALFGTPLTAAIFAMEVISIGIMEYAALVPCAISALIAREIAEMVGAHGEHFTIPASVNFDLKNGVLIVLLALLCAGVSILFCEILHRTERFFKTKIENAWLRAVVGGVLVIVLTKLLHTTDYLGTGMNIVEKAISGETVPEVRSSRHCLSVRHLAVCSDRPQVFPRHLLRPVVWQQYSAVSQTHRFPRCC